MALLPSGLLDSFEGDFLPQAGSGGAQLQQGTMGTHGIVIRQADQCAQLHERLIQHPAAHVLKPRQERTTDFCFCAFFCDICCGCTKPGNDPQYIAINSRAGELEADGSDGSSRIVTDAGQGTNGIVIYGEDAAVFPADHFRSLP